MGQTFLLYIDAPRIYICGHCRCHLANLDDLVSKAFQGRHGKAYLFDTITNFSLGPLEERTLNTGQHVVCDIFCKGCHRVIGWKYEVAHEPSQKYKEGKFIIERMQMIKLESS
mmetsp:Transcript_56851/g.64885  ORF Transcript_56851/g.64885 Transcript_56851/m.64885 type:complete len:113 (-) Transcript_56851:377-715(-)